MDSSDKKFLMVFVVVMSCIAALGVALALIANMAGGTEYAKSSSKVKLAAERIAPVGQVNLASAAGKSGEIVVAVVEKVATPESLYNEACAACHASGAAGAPKLGDKGAWAGRLGKGLDGLTSSAINGIGLMPARGGSSLSDDEIKSTVEYMLNSVK